jgi:phosphate/sulfate permease
MALCCLAVAFWFGWMYPWTRAIGEREVELMKARAIAIASGKAGTLIIAPAFTTQGSDTAWVVSAIASIHASPRTDHEADILMKSLACLLARGAPAAFRGAELDLMATFDAGAKSTQPTAVYIADLELTPWACNGP